MGEHYLDFDRGIELFNAGRYFEAHEEWEKLWLMAEKDSPPKLFVQGLIMLAAALDHYGKKEYAGTAKLLPQALERLTMYKKIGMELLDMDGLLRQASEFRERSTAEGGGIDAGEFPTIRKLEGK
jgi:predicted metal-dependent hydrolase